MYQQLQIKLLARCGLISLKQNRKKTLNEEYGNGFFRQLCNCLVAKKHWEPRNDKTLTSCYLLRISWITLITRNSWIICSMYPSVNWKRHPPSLKFCNNAAILLSGSWEMKAILKDTMQAYFRYCHTLLQTSILSGLNLSFNGCSFIQLKESKGMILEKKLVKKRRKYVIK